MNVLTVSHYFHPYSIGGTEDYALSLAREMIARGHSAHVFHGVIDRGTDDYHTFQHVHEGVPCTAVSVDLKSIADFSGTWRQAPVERILARLLDEERFDVAHVHHLTRLSTGIVDLLKQRGIPIVLTLHDYWMQCARGQRVRLDGETCHEIDEKRCAECMAPEIDFVDRRKPWWRRLGASSQDRGRRYLSTIEARRVEMQRVFDAVDVVLTPSRYTREAFRSWGVRREIQVEPPGVDPALANGFRETPSPVVRFGFLGRMTPTKGVEVLVDAFRKLDVEAELWIHGFGEPEYERMLKERAENARVRFAGPYTAADIPKVYSTFDVQVVPSTWLECSPLVVPTARLFKKPLVASRIGGLIELVRDGVDGLHFEVGSVQDLAAKMRSLAADPAKVAKLKDAIAAPRTAADHMAAIVKHYERLGAGRLSATG
jgi:glycosyltransferase involved in cell wall biosynthesis